MADLTGGFGQAAFLAVPCDATKRQRGRYSRSRVPPRHRQLGGYAVPATEKESVDTNNPISAESLEATLLQKRLRRRALFGILFTSLLVGGIGTYLLYRSHAEQLRSEIIFSSRLQAAAVDAELARLANIAVQITSRTGIRLKLESFYRGETDLVQLREFTEPKLADPLKLIKDLRGITRLGKDGRTLVQVGAPIAEELWPRRIAKDSPSIGNPGKDGGQFLLAVSAPIINRAGEWLGTDLLLFDPQRLQQAIAQFKEGQQSNGSAVAALGTHSENGTRLFFAPTGKANTATLSWLEGRLQQQAFEDRFLDTSNEGDPDSGQAIIVIANIPDRPWFFAYYCPAKAFYARAHRQALLSLGSILALTLVGLLLSNWLMRPLAGRISVQAHSLQALLRRNERLLSQVQASEAQLQAIVDNAPAVIYVKDPNGVYQLANASYERVVGKHRDEIVGQTDETLFGAEMAGQFRDNDRQVLNANQARNWDEKLPGPDGFHDYLSVKFPLYDASGTITGFAASPPTSASASESSARSRSRQQYSPVHRGNRHHRAERHRH